MRDGPVIYAGLLVFIGLFTFPVWRDAAAQATARGPEVSRPRGATQCVAPTAYMRTTHMQLLMALRDQAVRRADRTLVTPDGRTFAVSLTGTCLERCHGSRVDFCDRCHNYAAVKLDCFDCHVDAQRPVLRSAR